LLLSAAQAVGVAILVAGEAEGGQRACGALKDDRAVEAEILGAKGDFVENGGADDLVVGVLSDDAYLGTQLADCALFAGRDAIRRNHTRLGEQQTVGQASQGGLARAVAPQQNDVLPRRHRKGHVVERGVSRAGITI
jgi:hypothetical protein